MLTEQPQATPSTVKADYVVTVFELGNLMRALRELVIQLHTEANRPFPLHAEHSIDEDFHAAHWNGRRAATKRAVRRLETIIEDTSSRLP